MHFERFLRSRKAQEGAGGGEMEVGKTPLFLILEGIAALLIIGLVISGTSTLLASEAGQGTDETLARFSEALRKVAEGENGSKIELAALSFSDDDHVLAVFDTRPFLQDTCQINEPFYKPEECMGKMCVVICHEDDACKSPLSKPVIIENNKFGYVAVDSGFEANLGAEFEPGKEYPLIYSDCDGWGGEPLFGQGIKWVAIEAKEGYIFITDKACYNKQSAGKNANCERGTICSEGLVPVPDYKCREDEVCCI